MAQATPSLTPTLLFILDGFGHALGGQHHVALVGLVRPAHDRRIASRHLLDFLDEALREPQPPQRQARRRNGA